ncbi:MAG: NYN domain-containing protein, partial [bacterium]
KERKMKRAVAYIDGFNLYYGLIEAQFERYRWLDLRGMVASVVPDGQELILVKYFTTHISASLRDPGKAKRQLTYLEALQAYSKIQIILGNFMKKPTVCPKCACQYWVMNEKKSDVNLATHLIADAIDDIYDVAYVVSGDSDLSDAIRMVRRRYADKSVFVWFPPGRASTDLTSAASQSGIIGKKRFSRNQLPPQIRKADGFILEKPAEW